MYCVGQKVKVRKDLKIEKYGEVYTVSSMLDWIGKELTIRNIKRAIPTPAYCVEENEFLWEESMFEHEEFEKFVKDDIVIALDGEARKIVNKIGFYMGDDNKSTTPEIEYIENINGHDGRSDGCDGHCWYTERGCLKKAILQKCILKDTNKILSKAKAPMKFKNDVKPLYRRFANIKTIIPKGATCEIVYEDEECSALRWNGKIFAIEKSGYEIIKDEENTKSLVDIQILNKLSDSINNLSKKVEERNPFQEAMTEAIIEKGKEIAVEDLKEKLKGDLDKFIEEKYGVLPKVIKIERKGKTKETKGLFHKDFEKICKIVDSNVPLMLVGGAGAGKNHTLEQVAEALDLEFYTTNAVNQEYKLTGFIDANGKYHETEFYKAFTNGGMFFLDEIDASCPEALIILNGAIANKYFDFPTGRVKANEKFRVVCAGNTYGTGADMVYVGRNVLDGATLDRFVVVPFDYDENVEKTLAYDMELYEFIKSLRKAVNDSGLRYIVSMRALINATKLLEIGIDKETILKTAIVKNMQIDDINTIVKKISYQCSWTEELKKMSDIHD